MARPIYFAWTGPDIEFDPDAHNVEDEQIFAVTISHSEGDFPSLKIEVRNPRVGLLAAGRNLWCWLSYDGGSGIEPIFRGRLIGVPENLTNEIITLEFTAKPADYEDQKAALAETMKIPPYWDLVWIQDRIDDPDTVLEARPELWHVDRTTLEVTSSNIITGEDGTILIEADSHFYDGLSVNYGQNPLQRISVVGTVAWDQTATGEVDITRKIVEQFRLGGSNPQYPLIQSFTMPGLYDSWPNPGDSIGGGWTVGPATDIRKATWIGWPNYLIKYVDKSDSTPSFTFDPTRPYSPGNIVFAGWKQYEVVYQLAAASIKFTGQYEAKRKRSEIVRFSLEADCQPLLVDPGATEQEKIDLSSDQIGLPVDTGGAIPIGDLARPSYFKTDRGQLSFQYLLALARVKLLSRSRAVLVKFEVSWDDGLALSCRKNVELHDDRLPGGLCVGKVTEYELHFSTDKVGSQVTIGCCIGHGGSVSGDIGDPTYVENDVLEPGIQVYENAVLELLPGEMTYESFDDFVIVDDGVDFLQMTPARVVASVTVDGTLADQVIAINLGKNFRDPSGFLSETATRVRVEFVPVEGGPFNLVFEPVVSVLKVPKTIDLEAPAI